MMTSQLAPAPASIATAVLLDCVLPSTDTDPGVSTMRRLEEAFMETIVAGENDPTTGYHMATRLLALLPMMVDANSDDGRLRRFARAVSRTALRLADSVGGGALAETRDLVSRICEGHSAPCLQGVLEPLSLAV